MAGYSGTPLAKKLGIKEGTKVAVIGAPKGYRALLDPLPAAVRFATKADATADVVHFFSTKKSALAHRLASYRKTLSADAAVWVSWPKKSANVPTEITEDVVRELALPLGFVDIKVCAIDDMWGVYPRPHEAIGYGRPRGDGELVAAVAPADLQFLSA